MMLNFKKRYSLQTDAGMCGDYNSVVGMDMNNSLKDFWKKTQLNISLQKVASLSGVIVDNIETRLANKMKAIFLESIE